ncbi:hypothetical protein [Flavobacterium johnsoniae]|uniref:DUF4136 domain-containing protein n=1 Tax=Flavobacterium johnsoniae TaxID=986 RepID=A0A1J7BPL8_FLAJO|nr:hypothetical protein [Flavobacterium johnsoniae]OIV40525.1 hypothetical protein BKM63_16720 [Flavobacterium johnsoniae]
MKPLVYSLLIFSVFFVQCSSSNITSSWHSTQASSLQHGRIIVVGLIPESDKRLQQKMENHLADELCNLGYDAAASTDIYNFETYEGQDQKEIIKELKQNGIIAVLTIVLLDKQKETYHAPKSMFDAAETDTNNFDVYYNAIYSKINEHGYYVNNTYYFWESSLFVMPNQELVYSAKTQSFNPFSAPALAHEYGRLIINDMLEHNVIIDVYKQKNKKM